VWGGGGEQGRRGQLQEEARSAALPRHKAQAHGGAAATSSCTFFWQYSQLYWLSPSIVSGISMQLSESGEGAAK
jgi:hypothetical protein